MIPNKNMPASTFQQTSRLILLTHDPWLILATLNLAFHRPHATPRNAADTIEKSENRKVNTIYLPTSLYNNGLGKQHPTADRGETKIKIELCRPVHKSALNPSQSQSQSHLGCRRLGIESFPPRRSHVLALTGTSQPLVVAAAPSVIARTTTNRLPASQTALGWGCR